MKDEDCCHGQNYGKGPESGVPFCTLVCEKPSLVLLLREIERAGQEGLKLYRDKAGSDLIQGQLVRITSFTAAALKRFDN